MTQWRALTASDLPALAALTRSVLAADGGMPQSADEGFLRGRYLGGEALGAFESGELVASVAVRPVGPAPGPGQPGIGLTGIVAQVAPAYRGRGLGRHLLEWGLARAPRPRVETESWTPAVDRLLTGYGLERTFGELVMTCPLTTGGATLAPAATPLPDGIILEEWRPGNEADFFTAYDASFRDRPGFPGWSSGEWIDWISGDEDDFRADWALLARDAEGAPAGFCVASPDHAIGQAGVVPAWRRRGLGRALLTESANRMRAEGATSVLLMVATNNPGATALYESLGYVETGQRARYERG
ncbi:GNAT family N-acetyltransferase [Longispora fulva]|uniref:Ribosomal protein S18 acetylase RimI-like enzyme n=1 Tax=Longispora fulva TaxID=619741 RepID=A0A8J7GFK5_9ACTN|nr:GNAT family N-acetyltransferase [Longispora fulva]MBG6137949.1 ribosomal protein S18 acetylase RimI-like enzyme [Longispora fulva]